MYKTKRNLWFPNVRTDEKVKMRLFCLPFAGGNISTYRTWGSLLPDTIDVCPVQLPGRSNRLNESGFTEVRELTKMLFDELQPFLDYPFAIFGYSMGAILGFELIRLLNKQGINPAYLFVAAARAPQTPSRSPVIYDLPTEEFKKELLRLNGTPREVLENAELFEIMLPLLRADFELIETYDFTYGTPLNCPITAFGGNKDEEVFASELEQWAEQTSLNFKSIILDGNHFFMQLRSNEILQQIEADLRSHLAQL